MSLNDVYVSLSCFFGNRFYEIKHSRSILKKRWKAFKGKIYLRIGSTLQNKTKQNYKRFQEKMKKRLDRVDHFFGKYYSNGGKYQFTQNVDFNHGGEL